MKINIRILGSSHVDHSHQPGRQGSSSKFETLKQKNSHNHHGHSHNDSEESVNHKHDHELDLYNSNFGKDSPKDEEGAETKQTAHTSQPCLNGGNNVDDHHDHIEENAPSAEYHQHYSTNSRNISLSGKYCTEVNI